MFLLFAKPRHLVDARMSASLLRLLARLRRPQLSTTHHAATVAWLCLHGGLPRTDGAGIRRKGPVQPNEVSRSHVRCLADDEQAQAHGGTVSSCTLIIVFHALFCVFLLFFYLNISCIIYLFDSFLYSFGIYCIALHCIILLICSFINFINVIYLKLFRVEAMIPTASKHREAVDLLSKQMKNIVKNSSYNWVRPSIFDALFGKNKVKVTNAQK